MNTPFRIEDLVRIVRLVRRRRTMQYLWYSPQRRDWHRTTSKLDRQMRRWVLSQTQLN